MASYILVLQWPIELGGGAPLRRGRITAPDTPPVSLGSSSTQSFRSSELRPSGFQAPGLESELISESHDAPRDAC